MATEYLKPIYDLKEHNTYESDDSFSSCQYREYKCPQSDLTNLNKFKLIFNDESSYCNMADTMVELKFKIEKTTTATPDRTALEEEDNVHLADGWLLFNQVKCEVNNQIIGVSEDPGQQHYIRHLNEFSEDYLTIVEKQSFYPLMVCDVEGSDTVYRSEVDAISDNATANYPQNDHLSPIIRKYLNDSGGASSFLASPDRNPTYDMYFVRSADRNRSSEVVILLPLVELFPQLKALNKAVRGSRLELDLYKNEVEKCLYSVRESTPAGYELHLTFLTSSLWMKVLEPSIKTKAIIESQLASETIVKDHIKHVELYTRETIPASTTSNRVKVDVDSNRVQKIYVVFQKDIQNSDIQRSPVQYEDLNISTLSVFINGHQFPRQQYNFQDGTVRAYHDLLDSKKLLGDYEDGMIITKEAFDDCMRVYVFETKDLPDSFEEMKISNVELRYTLSQNASSTYTVRILIESDRMIELKQRAGKSKVNLIST